MSPESVPRNADGPGVSPYDTWLSSGSRFLIEIAAWTAGPWAAGDLLGSPWWAIPTLAVLLVLPGLFNVPGDKHVTGVPTPGPVRIVIELLLLVAAVGGAWLVWPVWLAALVTLVGLTMLGSGAARYRWLSAGAPEVPR